MSAASLRTSCPHVCLLVGTLFLMSLGTLVGAANQKTASLEESSLVQSKIVMKTGVRKVEPLQAGEELDDDEDLSATDDDNPSLMQAGVCTKRSKSKLRPLVEEEIDDELSMMQTTLALNRAQPEDSDENGIEEEEDQFSAMQTSVTVMSAERLVGTGRPNGEEDDFDGASFIQNEATFIKKSDRTDTGCTNGQLEASQDDDATDEVSLVQTDVVLNRAPVEEAEDYGIEEEEEEQFSAMQSVVTVTSGERHVGTGRHSGEEDDFDGASFMQNDATVIKKSDTGCTNGASGSLDEDSTDAVSLMQTDVVVNRAQLEEEEEGIEEEDDVFSAMQTSVTVMSAERLVGSGRPDGEEDEFDGASFMQNEATFIKKSDRIDTSCTSDEDEDDVMSL